MLKVFDKQNAGDFVYEQMLSALSEGDWKPGMRLPSENELASSLGVSRITVRGALQKLAALQLVESRQGEGTFVSEYAGAQIITPIIPALVHEAKVIFNMLEFRAVFECGCAAVAAKSADSADISSLEEAVEGLKNKRLDAEKRRKCDADFHVAIGKATHNQIISSVYDVLKYSFYVSIEEVSKKMGFGNAIHYHTLILDAISQKDEKKAFDAMKEHIEDTCEVMGTLVKE